MRRVLLAAEAASGSVGSGGSDGSDTTPGGTATSSSSSSSSSSSDDDDAAAAVVEEEGEGSGAASFRPDAVIFNALLRLHVKKRYERVCGIRVARIVYEHVYVYT